MFPHLLLWLMRPKLRPEGHTTEKTARLGEPFGCSPSVAAPLVSPRSVERNYKDTTNGARTLTAKPWAVGLGKAFGLGVGMFFERGGAFRLVQDNALQQDGKKVHYFYMKSSARGLETAGPGENRQIRTPEPLPRRFGFELAQALVKVFLLVLHLQEVIIIDAHLGLKV